MAILQRTASLLVLTAALTFAAYPATAEDYPSRTVKIIVPFGAGGPTDVYTRAIAEELRKSLHQIFVMENRPGAGTTIGTDAVAKAPPDGYTLLMISGTQTVNETLYSKKPYQLMRDLVPIAPLIDTDLVLVVPASLPVKTVPELLACDLQAESGAQATIKDGIAYCESVRDYVSRDVLQHILDATEEHIDYLDTQIDLVAKVGLENYLQSQMGVHGD